MHQVPYNKIATTIYILAVPVSAVIGLLIGFFTNESGWVASLVGASFLSILGLSASVMDLQQRIEHQREDHRRVTEIAEFFRLVSNLAENDDDIFRRRAKEIIERTQARLKSAADGKLFLDGIDRVSLPLELAETVGRELLATSFWGENDPLGQTRSPYLLLLYSAAKRKEPKVKVKRLFLIKCGQEDDPELKERILKDTNEGDVEVRLLFVDQWIGGEEELTDPLDFGVWDRRRIWSYQPKEMGGTQSRLAMLLTGDYHVNRYVKTFKANFERGKSLDDFVKTFQSSLEIE